MSSSESSASSSSSSSSSASSRSASSSSSKDSVSHSGSSLRSPSKGSASKASSRKSIKSSVQPDGDASKSTPSQASESEQYSSDDVSDIVTESTIVEDAPIDERRRLIESYAKYQKTRGKLAQYASTSTQFTATEKKISTNHVHGMVQRLYRPQLLLQRTKEDLHRRKGQKKVDNFDSANDKHLTKYWEHRRQVDAKLTKRREAARAKRERQRSTSPPTERPMPVKETSNPRGNDAAVPIPPPRCLPAIVAQEEGSSKRLIFSNGGRTLVLQDDNVSECSESTAASSLPPLSESSASQSLRSVVTNKGVTEAELSGMWLLVDPPPELALSVRGMSITDANTMGVELSWMAVHKREVTKIKEQLPSPHRYGRKKYQLKCQKDAADLVPPAASEPSSRNALVYELVEQVLNSALQIAAASQSPTKGAAGSKGQKGPTGPMVTLLDIPLEPHDESSSASDMSHDSHIKINSPRSGLIMLRNGTSLSDLAPTPFAVFAKEGSLAGVPQFASEKRYLSKESKRRQLLRRLQSEYSTLCGELSRSEFMDVLYAAKPGAAVEDTSTFSQIIDYKRSRQQELAARHAEKLELLVQMAKDKCIDVKAGNEKIQRFENARAAKWKLQAEERERQREIKARRLQRVKEDAKEIANINRCGLLTKLESEEQRKQKLDEQRQHDRFVEAEALKEGIELKRQQKVRHNRLEELKRAQAADRIRAKMSKIERQKKLSEELVKQLRYEQEMAKFRDELTKKAAEEDILAYRRKHQV